MVFTVLAWRFGFHVLIASRVSLFSQLESSGIDTAERLWSSRSWSGVLDLMHWLHCGGLRLIRSSLTALIPPSSYGLTRLGMAFWIRCIDCIAGVFVFPARVLRHLYRRALMVLPVLAWRFGFNALIASRRSSSFSHDSFGVERATSCSLLEGCSCLSYSSRILCA